MTSLEVFPNHDVDLRAYGLAHRRGERPEPLPYGMQHLQEHGWALRLPMPPRTPAQQLANRLGGRLDGLPWGWGLRRRPRDRTTTVCWDERSSVPLAVLTGRRPLSGVIWIPDRSPTRLQLEVLRRLPAAWALSEAQVEPLRDLGVADGTVEYLEYGVASRFFTPGAPDDIVPGRIVCIGNDRHRDYETLVAAVARVRRETDLRPSLVVVTRGQVDVPADIGVHISERLGAEALRDLYRSAAMAVVPCLENLHGSGMTSALETLACGRPVVATSAPGMERYVDPGRSGLMAPAGDVATMADQIVRLLEDPAYANELGRVGRRDVEGRLSSSAMMARLDGFIRRHASR